MNLIGRFGSLAAVLLFAQALTMAQPSVDSAQMPVANTITGQLRGGLLYDGVAFFKNIPFAQPPVGNLRWREPLSPKSWNGIREASTFGPACSQAGHLNSVSSEDCLQLNVWTPSWPVKGSLPVMLWFHGGGNTAGSAIEPLFNGENFARRGVILVSANYRLGVFGFFAYPDLTKESPHHSSGNYALLDQIAAMQWVHDNIANFGGDPANVTIFGESAGAMDVNALLTVPASKGLFARAIAESGAAGAAQTLAEAETKGVALAGRLNITGADTLAKLRAVSTEDLLKASTAGPGGGGGGMLGLNVDGWVLPESPDRAFAAGHEHKVSLLFGNNSQELQKPFAGSMDDSRTAIAKQFGPLAGRALLAYQLNGPTDPQPDPEFGNVGAQLATDSAFRCGTIEELNWHTTAGNAAYEYQFSIPVHSKKEQGAPHAAEIPFVFGSLHVWQGMRGYTLSDWQYATVIQEYWINFAKTGDPNGPGLISWPKYDSAKRGYLDFQENGPVAGEGLRRAVCDVFAENTKRIWAHID